MDRTDIHKIWIDNEAIWIETKTGQIGCEHLADYSRLRNADRKAIEGYTLSYYGIHWPELDEDLSFDGFFSNSRMLKA
ncbi:MAG: DUF2442 domain-containing protein [Muribaculaceae bacterium]|nr:DUF2442 domain-containing protein [Muribaculaceae bacterium]